MAATEDTAAGPELVIGLVAPAGTDLDLVCDALRETLAEVRYDCGDAIRLSALLDGVDHPDFRSLKKRPEDERYQSYMEAGTHLRELLGRGDALALLAIEVICEFRAAQGMAERSLPRRAYLIRSLKHPEEVRTLRRIYGPAFVLIAAYSPREQRIVELSRRIAESYQEFVSRDFRAQAEMIVKRDESETGRPLGQNVRRVFPEADIFVDAGEPKRLRDSIARGIELLFGNTFHTPNRDEYGMFHAKAAALRSASLQRQVGAAITTADGDVIAIGTNEVPKAGGGLYWCGDQPDRRDFVYGYEINDRMKRRMVADVLERIRKAGWLNPEKTTAEIDDLLAAALTGTDPFLQNSRAMEVIEFGRCVHAEMAALIDAARRGVRVNKGVLYTTTFPCHECARHIVASGVSRVVYIEPYPKSLAPDLYPDSIAVDEAGGVGERVKFEPFVGIAPRRYMEWFAMTERKDATGNRLPWPKSQAKARLGEYPLPEVAKLVLETSELDGFKEQRDRWLAERLNV